MQRENVTEAVPESGKETAQEAVLSTLVDISILIHARCHTPSQISGENPVRVLSTQMQPATQVNVTVGGEEEEVMYESVWTSIANPVNKCRQETPKGKGSISQVLYSVTHAVFYTSH